MQALTLFFHLFRDMSGHSTDQLAVAPSKSTSQGKQGRVIPITPPRSLTNFTKGRGCPWPHYLQAVTWTSRKRDILGALMLCFIYTISQCQGETAHRQEEAFPHKIQKSKWSLCCSTLTYLSVLLHKYSSVKLSAVFHLLCLDNCHPHEQYPYFMSGEVLHHFVCCLWSCLWKELYTGPGS